jgi:hypothetical protein
MQSFAHLAPARTMDLYSLSRPPPGLNQMLHKRHRVTELAVAEGVVFGLTENGVCVAYCLHTARQLCVLNASASEVVRSLFHNKCNGTLITVSVYASDQFACLRCRATALSRLREGVATEATPLFTSESLSWPGFVEFDDVNAKILTYSAECVSREVNSGPHALLTSSRHALLTSRLRSLVGAASPSTRPGVWPSPRGCSTGSHRAQRVRGASRRSRSRRA